MAKKVENLSLNLVGLLDEGQELQDSVSKQYHVDGQIFMTMNAKDLGQRFMSAGQPYRIDEGRVMIVTSGWVRLVINLEEQLLERQSVIVLVPDSIFEIVDRSDDFDMCAFSFKELPIFTSLSHQTILSLDTEEWALALEYIQLIWHEVCRQSPMYDVITHLQMAFLTSLKHIADREESLREKTASRQDKIFHEFINLVNQYGLRERKIEFYADKLCVTPNHLGAVIKHASGLTIMQWLNRHTIQKAKVLLRYSDLPIWEVAERMNFANPSFFSKFFKKETGMTPGEYRL